VQHFSTNLSDTFVKKIIGSRGTVIAIGSYQGLSIYIILVAEHSTLQSLMWIG